MFGVHARPCAATLVKRRCSGSDLASDPGHRRHDFTLIETMNSDLQPLFGRDLLGRDAPLALQRPL